MASTETGVGDVAGGGDGGGNDDGGVGIGEGGGGDKIGMTGSSNWTSASKYSRGVHPLTGVRSALRRGGTGVGVRGIYSGLGEGSQISRLNFGGVGHGARGSVEGSHPPERPISSSSS